MYRKLFLSKSLLLMMLSLSTASFLYADSKINENNLEKIRIKVQQTESNLKDLTDEITDLSNEINKSNIEIKKIISEKEKAISIRKKNEEELKALEKSVQKLRNDAVLLVNRSKGRLKALYRERPVQDLLSFLFSDKNNNGSRIAFYVSKIRNYDKKLMVDILSIRRDYAMKVNQKKKILAENEVLEKKLIKAESAEQNVINKKKNMLTFLTRKEAQIEKELNELRAQALRIETVLKSVTNGEDFVIEKKYDTDSDEKEDVEEVKPFKGKGLLALKGKLPLPVKGKIVKTFGRHQVKKFKDFVISKGVEFAVSNGTQAYAVAKGKVIYNGIMPGYGRMIILDHGERYYTLYSHLMNVDIKLGEVLDNGDLIGECDVDDKNTNFYFEIRKDGKPIDPKLYLIRS